MGLNFFSPTFLGSYDEECGKLACVCPIRIAWRPTNLIKPSLSTVIIKFREQVFCSRKLLTFLNFEFNELILKQKYTRSTITFWLTRIVPFWQLQFSYWICWLLASYFRIISMFAINVSSDNIALYLLPTTNICLFGLYSVLVYVTSTRALQERKNLYPMDISANNVYFIIAPQNTVPSRPKVIHLHNSKFQWIDWLRHR